MKRITMTAMTALMALCLVLTACNTGSTSSTATPSSESTTSSSSADNKAESTTTEPLEEMSLSVEVFDRANYPAPSTANENPLTEWIIAKAKEELNINLSFVPIPRSQEYEKINVMMAGNTAPDIIFTYNVSAPSNFSSQGGLTDLTPYLDEYGPLIKEIMAEQLPYGNIGGGQYAIPARRINDDLKHATYIRKDILDKHSLEVPTTKVDFYNALKVVKENEPDMVPYAMATANNERYYENFVMSYAEYADEKEFYTYNSDNTRMISPGTKEGFRELNKWYNEGLISVDFAMDNEAKTYDADVSSGKAFAFTDDVGRPMENVKVVESTVEGAKFTVTSTFENSKGEYAANRYAPIGMYIMVPKASEAVAPAAIRYLNWMLEGDNIETLKKGKDIEGAFQDDNSNWIAKPKEELELIGLHADNFSDLGIIQSRVPLPNEEAYIAEAVKATSTDGFDSTDIQNDIYKVRKAPGIYITPSAGGPTEGEGKYGSDVRSNIKNMAARLIASKPEAFDALWDSEYNALLVSGLQTILDERAALYDNKA